MLQDSLAAEIEGTMRKELSLDDPECEEQKYVFGEKSYFCRGFVIYSKLDVANHATFSDVLEYF